MRYTKFYIAFLLIIIFSTKLSAHYLLKTGINNITGSVGLSLSYQEYDYSKDKYATISIQPSFGYFVTNNFLVRGQLAFNNTEDDQSDKINGPSYK